ncbi:hypothetical protein HYQ46_009727 [Verticillium longisporum]|nr:hypothetical protein HYQ46_009727 [Verticillium longisporum]
MVSEEIRVEIHEAGELSPLPGQTQRRTRRLPRLLSRSGNGSQQRYDSESGATQRATMVTSGGGAGIGVGVDDSRHGAPNDGTIEMKMLSEVRSNVHTGAGLQISNIEVEQASESGATQRATMVTSGGGVGVDDSRHGAPNDGTIEMKTLPEVRSNVHTGVGMQISNIEVEQASEVPTFVDELFTICIDGR